MIWQRDVRASDISSALIVKVSLGLPSEKSMNENFEMRDDLL